MTTSGTTSHRRFLAWLDQQTARDDDTGVLARAHVAGQVDLTWPDAAGETSTVRAAMQMARSAFDAADANGDLNPDGTVNQARRQRRLDELAGRQGNRPGRRSLRTAAPIRDRRGRQ